MGLSTPVDREFAVHPAGFIRDHVVLANFRAGLRTRINPETNAFFTEDEIAKATRPGSRWYQQAQAVDDYGQGRQRNAIWLADQMRADRASTKWLIEFHGRPRIGDPLPATGSGGTVLVTGVAGTPVVGSTTLGAPGVYVARAPDGTLYQVFLGAEVAPSGSVSVLLAALSTGSVTNLPAGTVLTWVSRDPNMAPTCVVSSDFTGGTDVETNAEYLQRYQSVLRYKPAIGNDAQVNAWARASSNAIENAFVYATAWRAGSWMVAITAKRGNTVGPLARIPNAVTLAKAIGYLVPPNSAVMPPRSYGVVLTPNPEPTNIVARLGLQRGSDAGWADATPFPAYHATTPTITSIVSPTAFRINCPANTTLPGQPALATVTGTNAPRMMVWSAATSRFFELYVNSVQHISGTTYEVTLDAEPNGWVPAVGVVVSPFAMRNATIAIETELYMDSLGPGQLFDIDTDSRGGRCVRFPEVEEEFPSRAGASLATRIREALGGGNENVEIASLSLTEPTYPTDLMNGPNMLTLGTFGIYEL